MNNNMTTETLAIALWADFAKDWSVTDQGAALAIHLGTLNYSAVEDAQTLVDDESYLVLTDEEANERCTEHIKETLWAFNASFLAGETGIDEEVFTRLAEGYESSNPAFEAIINANGGMDSFVEAAIGADGRGHFLAGYDHNENKVTYNGTTYYIYRVN